MPHVLPPSPDGSREADQSSAHLRGRAAAERLHAALAGPDTGHRDCRKAGRFPPARPAAALQVFSRRDTASARSKDGVQSLSQRINPLESEVLSPREKAMTRKTAMIAV